MGPLDSTETMKKRKRKKIFQLQKNCGKISLEDNSTSVA